MTTPPNQTNEEIAKSFIKRMKNTLYWPSPIARDKTLIKFESFLLKALASQEERHREIVICSAVIEEDGTIIRGHRHNDCFAAIQNRGKKAIKRDDGLTQQGFITSRNRFVDRVEWLRLQKEAGIPSADPSGEYRSNELYSEDLY